MDEMRVEMLMMADLLQDIVLPEKERDSRVRVEGDSSRVH